MIKKQTIKMIEYLSLFLVLSYLIFHNIYFVFFGIILAFYSLNSFVITNIIVDFVNKIKLVKKSEKDLKIFKSEKDDANNLALVEVIEESGFIPSANKKDDLNAA